MAEERIRGLSIGLSMDDVGIRRSLSAIKDSFREVRSSAQVNLNNIRFDTKNLKSYEGHVKELTKTFEQQQNNVNDLKSRYDELVAAGKENTQEAQRLRTEFNKQADELNKLGHQLKIAKDRMQELYVENSRFSKIGKTFDNIGSSLQSVGGKMKDIGGQLTNYITKPAVGAVSALGGIALFTGFNRLVGIDSARAKLQGLGHDAGTVESIMDNALASVKGTSFGMGEAANTAANAVAAGIEPGKELTRYLSLTGDAAAIAGTDMQEMGSIFNKVQTNNKIQAEEMNQLLDRGIPIIQLLAAEMGVAEDEVRDLASAGEISAEDFLNAIEGGFGGAAQIMGETSFTAAFDNMKAALGRVGAAFLDAGDQGGGFFSQLKPLMADITTAFDNMEDVAADWGVKFGEIFTSAVEKIKNAIQWFSDLDESQQKLIGVLGAVAVAAGPLLVAFGSIMTVTGKVSGAFGGLFGWLGRISGGITTVMKGVKPFAKVFPKLGGLVKGLSGAFTFLTGPVGFTIAAIAALGTGFVIAYQKSETFRNFIGRIGERLSEAWGAVVQFKDNLVQAFEGIFKIFSDNPMTRNQGTAMLRALGLSNESIGRIVTTVENIKRTFENMVEGVKNVLGTIGDFFREIFRGIQSWWKSDGEMILSAISISFQFAFDLIASVVKVAADTIVATFKFFMPLIQSIWNTVWPVLVAVAKTAWENIKLVVGVGMDLIKGIISAVSAIITGDWSRFGEILRETAQSIWKRVTEYFSNMRANVMELVDRLTGGAVTKFVELRDGAIDKVVGLYNSVTQWFRDLWSDLTTRATNLKNDVVRSFTELKDSAINRVVELFNSIVQWFRDLWTNVTTRVRDMKTNVITTFTNLKNDAIRRVRELYEGVRDRFRDTYDAVVEWVTNAKNKAVSLATDMKDGMIDKAKEIMDYFTSFPRRLGDAISRGGTAFKNGFANLMNSGISAVESGVNAIIRGIEWVFEKLGSKTTLGRWSAPRVSTGNSSRSSGNSQTRGIARLAKGTDHHHGGPAIVGDGGMKELIIYPNGHLAMSPDKDTLVDIPRGTQVLSGLETKKLMDDFGVPAYKNGIGAKLKDIGGQIWNWVSGGAKNLLNKALSWLGIGSPTGPGVFGSIAKAAFGAVKDKAFSFVDNFMKTIGPPGGINFSGLRRTSGYGPRRSPGGIGSTFHQGVDFAGPVGTQILSQTPGVVSASAYHPISGNYVMVDQGIYRYRYQHNLRNLVSRGQRVTKGQPLALLGSTGASTGPHLHFEIWRNGRRINPEPFIGGFKDGGLVNTPGVYELAEGGWPEFVIPTDPGKRTDAMKLLALAAKRIQGNKKPQQLPSASQSSDGSSGTLMQLLEATLEQNRILRRLLDKEVSISREVLTEAVDEQNALNGKGAYFA